MVVLIKNQQSFWVYFMLKFAKINVALKAVAFWPSRLILCLFMGVSSALAQSGAQILAPPSLPPSLPGGTNLPSLPPSAPWAWTRAYPSLKQMRAHASWWHQLLLSRLPLTGLAIRECWVMAKARRERRPRPAQPAGSGRHHQPGARQRGRPRARERRMNEGCHDSARLFSPGRPSLSDSASTRAVGGC